MEAVYKSYKPAWKGFYLQFLLMLLLLVLGCLAQKVEVLASWSKLLWIVIAIVEALIFFYIVVKRSIVSLELRDDPVTCNPLKPFSADFRSSIEIGLANVEHIKVGQTMIQSMLNIGDIVITSSGTGNEEIHARNLPKPEAIRDEIQIHARKYTMS